MLLSRHRPPVGPSARPRLEQLDDRALPSHTAYLATDLASDQPGVAPLTDPTLVNAWGISLNPNGGAFWVSANGTGVSEVYPGDVTGSPLVKAFDVAAPGGALTGQVFNPTTDFKVTAGGRTAPAVFIFASESEAVTGWNPAVPPPPLSRVAEVGYQAADGAVYKGMALANTPAGNVLYLADFHNGKIDVLDAQFKKMAPGTNGFGTFADPNLPAGYAPFNVAAIGNKLYVTYAKQDADKHDDVPGRGNGFISVFDLTGHFQTRLTSRGPLDSPWGVVQAPAAFGEFGGALLVGNFGDGRIHAYDPATGELLGTLRKGEQPLVIDGLWGLAFGNGKTAGDANALYYAAGPDGEAHGLFGRITANPAGTNPVSAKLTGDVLTITGSRDADHVTVDLNRAGDTLIVHASTGEDGDGEGDDGGVIGQFDAAAVGTIRFQGWAGDDTIVVSPRVTVTTILDGGAGNDRIVGGGGNNILLGNAGNDVLIGRGGRGILIGGDGSDVLVGGRGDDLLIGGRTTYDANAVALLQIMGAWASADSFATRVAKLRAGTGGLPKLDAATVLDDGVRDDLFGGSVLDWFFAVPIDVIHDRTAGEPVN